MIAADVAASGSDRILHYFRAYERTAIAGDELMVVAGIGEWARRVRELRVQAGWQIVSGVTLAEMLGADDETSETAALPRLAADEYMLLDAAQDREAAHRWHAANVDPQVPRRRARQAPGVPS